MPMRGELPPITARLSTCASARGWSRLTAVLLNPDLQAIAAFCTIGILLTVNAVLWFPDFGELVAQLASFPAG